MERKDSYYVPNLGQTVEAGEYAGQRDIEIMALKKQAGKNNNAFIMGMRNLDEPVPLGLFDGYVEKKVKEKGIETRSSLWEATKGFGKGFGEGVVKSPAGRWAGYAATNSIPLIAKTATTLYAASGAAGGVEEADKYIRQANKGIEAWSKEMQRLTGIDNAETVESIVGNALGSVWGSVAIGSLTGKMSVAPAFGVSAFQDTYSRQREKGTEIGESAIRGGVHGTGEAALEALQFNRIFGNLAKKSKPIAIIKDLLENSVQEGLQQANEIGANWNIDERTLNSRGLISVLQEIGASMVGGAIASLGGSVGGNILNRKSIDEVGDLMKKTGHTDEEIQTVKENLNKIVDTDELQQAANQVAKDELTTIALTYKEQAQATSEALVKEINNTIERNELVDMEGTEGMPPLYQLGELQVDTQKNPYLGKVLYQAQQEGQPIETLGQVFEWAKGKLDLEETAKLNTGINAVYNQTYEQLKSFGQDDKLADSNAHIRSSMAFSIAKNFGVSVEEANNMLGGIVSQKEADFSAMEKQNEVLKQSTDIARENERLDSIYPKYTGETININGVEKTVYNSSGERIAQSKEALQNFYNWFGDSKVVDEEGRPLVVYHATNAEFDTFDTSRGEYKGYIWTTSERDSFRAKHSLYNMPLYIKIENPKVIKGFSYAYTRQDTRERLVNEGYDGVDNGLGDYVAFNPTQIKSIDNRGTYSPTEGNIYYQSEQDVKDLVVQHATTLNKLNMALELGGLPMPSLAVTKKDLAASGRFGEITFVGGSDIIDPSFHRGSKTYSADIYSPRMERPLYELTVEGEKYIDSIGAKTWYLDSDALERIKDASESSYSSGREPRYVYLHSLGKDVEFDYDSIDKAFKELTQEQKDKMPAFLKDFINKYTKKKLFKGFTPSGKRTYLEYNIDNVIKLMKENGVVGQEHGFGTNPNVLKSVWSKPLKTIKEIKKQKNRIVSQEEYKKVGDEYHDAFYKMADKLITNGTKQLLEGTYTDPYDHVVAWLTEIKDGSDIKAILKEGALNDSDEAVNEVKSFVEYARQVPTQYFENKPVRAVDFNEFSGVIMPSNNAYDEVANILSNEYGLDVQRVSDISNKEETQKALDNIQQKYPRTFFQDEANPRGAYYNGTVYLFENADQSTFVHEMSHAYMDVIQRLADSGNEKAQSDLNVIRNWLGKKQGEAFTEADWERFARGFETYIREGKAPNEYLGGKEGVFASFRNWLLGIYGGIKSLTVKNEKGKTEPVKINDNIRSFYDEMLGGADIDEVLNNAIQNQQSIAVVENKLKELADVQQRLAEERAKLVREMANNVKPDTTWANVKDWGKNVWESAKELPTNVLQSSYERLAKIDPRLGLLVQKAEQSQGLRLKKWADEIKPFYEAFNKLSNEDKAKVQYFLLNQQWGDVEDILGKEGTEAVHGMLEEIYNELQDSGVEVGYRDNYFPRAVLDYDGLLQEMGLTYPSLRKEMEEALGKDATPQEQAEWLDKHIMGFKGNVSLNQNRNTKERKLELITDRMAKYYKPSMETLVDYMNGMAKLLSMREAFGRDIEYKESTAEDSIGKIINRLFGDNKFTKKEIDEVREVLSALYLPNGIGNKFLQAMRQYGYATKLSYSTTVRQFADIGMMMKVNGVLNTLDALFHPDKRITLETLGIDPLGEEFQTSKKDIGGKLANIATKWKGINWADAIMKNAFMRGNYKSLQELAKTPDKFHQKYDALFGDETDTLIEDLNNNKLSEPVKVLLFHEISKIQPISRSAMPTAYLQNPNGRVFYMFKTFSLHRAEYMVGELADDFRRGDYKKAGKDIMADVAVIGWEGLVELLIAFLKYGWQALAIEAVLETFAGSGLGVFGLNKHQALQISRGQIGDFFQQMVGVGTPFDDIGYMIRHYDDSDKLLRAFLPDMILEPLIVGPKPINNKSKKVY